ncbi:MAG: hypothetical protein ATN36_06645 [Epulopiscium sp. Nele67-Bin005]|nr:MAG: hypothetical protein ATN36_06645 [Epulopiscium sp. Nele67-Bin005]
MQQEIGEKLGRILALTENNAQRLNVLENKVDDNLIVSNDTHKNVALLSQRLEIVEKTSTKNENRLDEIDAKPNKLLDSFQQNAVGYIAMAITAGILANSIIL